MFHSVFFFLLYVAMVAAPAVEVATKAEPLSVSMLVIAVIGLLGLAERVAALVKKYRGLLQVFFDIVEHYSGSMNEADRNVAGKLKESFSVLSEHLPKDARDLADDLAAKAEKKVGKNGGATEKLANRPVLRFLLKRAARKFPIIGSFF